MPTLVRPRSVRRTLLERPGGFTYSVELASFPFRSDVWQAVPNAPEPSAFGLPFTVGRLRESAAVTITNAFADAYFGRFGTSDRPVPSPVV